jgi:hypothetical protein
MAHIAGAGLAREQSEQFSALPQTIGIHNAFFPGQPHIPDHPHRPPGPCPCRVHPGGDRERMIQMITRIEEMDKRFDQMGKRIDDLRTDTNKRFD